MREETQLRLSDSHPRVDTLRIAVTDRCNLRCVYCMPRSGISLLPFEEILTYEEIVRVARICLDLGIEKIRITGGEPLVRKDLTSLIYRLSTISGLKDLSLTTNGVLLAQQARELQQAGLHRVTVSLDTLRRERYQAITGRDELPRVLEGISTLFRCGIEPVKINTVIIPGINDDEVVPFAMLTRKLPVEVRFIERMPFEEGSRTLHGCGLWQREVLPGKVILETIQRELGPLEPASPAVSIPGPAKLYRLHVAKGRIGIISPVTEPFCSSCGRIRLTPEGRLRQCLLREEEVDLKWFLRRGVSDNVLRAVIADVMAKKQLCRRGDFLLVRKAMVQIGG